MDRRRQRQRRAAALAAEAALAVEAAQPPPPRQPPAPPAHLVPLMNLHPWSVEYRFRMRVREAEREWAVEVVASALFRDNLSMDEAIENVRREHGVEPVDLFEMAGGEDTLHGRAFFIALEMRRDRAAAEAEEAGWVEN